MQKSNNKICTNQNIFFCEIGSPGSHGSPFKRTLDLITNLNIAVKIVKTKQNLSRNPLTGPGIVA